ncbi:hypothetical protein Pmar_PMAR009423 [Perkinsus marinus ATCC 50983]|uniref:Ribonuclease P/MRP protein subunit POP5 n=1 Tax=Perkinsus marinus (strain ATCC 50983 / TXsc) TaxID=423536 RepID=C5KL20_PERM5|nr:hypothetical protein Pmar_PMAR009423 [Perkinsus marinus ATCC 50983]EER14828.1 hypothetical protein Pmar_PMAR009423 [Perkinsus marinus ATCC 50983]|eukprot:XP_002783032.1 hypothetical protein Pmar_PMAR009423 [Perkinsus marinus ATCC 50983]
MAGRVSSRYLVLELQPADGQSSIANVIKTSLEKEVRAAIHTNFGDYGAAMIGQVTKVAEVVDITPRRVIAVIKTPAFHTEDCVGSLDTSLRSVKVGSGREMPIKFRVVAIVGSAPNVRKRILYYMVEGLGVADEKKLKTISERLDTLT